MMVQVSVVILTFNEERNIGRCIDSVKSFADEVVVVDSFSTDGAEKICEQKGARFIKHAWEGYIEQKNFAMTQAKYMHVLSLDADEEVSGELAKSIIAAKENWRYDGYTMNRLNNYCGQWIRHGGWYPDRKLRLMDSKKGKWGGVNPHDKYELNEGTTCGRLNGDLFHYSYNTLTEHVLQQNKFSEISADDFTNIKDLYTPAALKGKGAGVLYDLKDEKKAITNYRKTYSRPH